MLLFIMWLFIYRCDAFFGGFFQYIFERGIVLVGYYSVEYGVLYRGLQLAHQGARLEREDAHYLLAIDGGLEIAYSVFLLYVFELLSHGLEVLQEFFLAHFVLRGDVGLAQLHQVVDVVAGVEE